MPSVLDMVTGSLPATATYARRDYVWVPASGGAYADGRIGSLTLVLQRSRRPGAKVETDTYGVDEELDRPLPAGVRAFLLANDTDPEQPDVYRCVVGSDAGGLVHDRCACRAGEVGKTCKHLDAINTLVTDEVL
jgi:hypothetical protein